METVGNINRTYNEYNVEWLIPNFFALYAEESKYYDSPIFPFNGAIWYLRMYPNGDEDYDAVGYLDILLGRKSGTKIRLDFSLSIKNSNGTKEEETRYIHDFKKKSRCGTCNYISRSELLRRKSELLPGDALTVVCAIKYPESNETIASGKLSDDLKTIMMSGNHSDTVVKVKSEEFRLHRSILAARNTYFNSMFQSDMKEKSTGIITIQDCEPNIFRSFIHFVYSGKVDKCSPENVCELYTVADKYQEDQLKTECLNFMLNTMPLDHFCDYFILAFTHDEKELLKKCVELFTSNGKEIVRSVKWQALLEQYPIQANELLIRHFDCLNQ